MPLMILLYYGYSDTDYMVVMWYYGYSDTDYMVVMWYYGTKDTGDKMVLWYYSTSGTDDTGWYYGTTVLVVPMIQGGTNVGLARQHPRGSMNTHTWVWVTGSQGGKYTKTNARRNMERQE